jgi:hypothetical protein
MTVYKRSTRILQALFFFIFILCAGSFLAQDNAKSAVPDTTQKKAQVRNFQVTVIPPLGTNGIDCYKITNHLSFNVLAGVQGGLDGLEMGTYANVILKDARGIQAAGFTNVVLHNVKGAQFSGFANYVGGNLTGAAFSGFVNVGLGNLKGAQFSGFCNVNMGKMLGAQLSGFVNYNRKSARGLQAAGYVNVVTDSLTGGQLAGFVNVAGNVNGFQGAGFVNIAKNVKGIQAGFVNIADSVDGASIGFCNIVKKGLHQVEVSVDELFFSNLAVRTGSNRFYNIFSAGIGSRPQGNIWSIGYGAGTSFGISEKLRSDVSLSVSHVSNGLLYHATSELYRIYWGVECKLAHKCFVAAGPTFNLYWGDALQPDFAKNYSGISPYSFVNETNTEGFNFKAWVGARLAFRFL